MGRPVNKKFFGNPASPGYQIEVSAWFAGEGAAEPAYIVSQRSNSVYVVASVAGPGTRTGSLRLVEGAPGAAGQMRVVVTPVTGSQLIAAQDETDYDVFVGGTDYINGEVITLSNGATVTVDAQAAGVVTEFTITTTGPATAGQVLTQASTDESGVGFTLTVGADNLENSLGTAESARIINQHTVKTFEENVYSWRAGEASDRPFAIIGS